jgi:hypothetical protein
MGSWTTKASPISGEYWEVRDGDGGIAADMIPDEAIARLIAAAPEMLALLGECSSALADLLSYTDPSGFECQEQWACVAECKAAIAKAEGRE